MAGSQHCIQNHLRFAIAAGASREELQEAIFLVIAMKGASIIGGGGPHTQSQLEQLLAGVIHNPSPS